MHFNSLYPSSRDLLGYSVGIRRNLNNASLLSNARWCKNLMIDLRFANSTERARMANYPVQHEAFGCLRNFDSRPIAKTARGRRGADGLTGELQV